MLACIIDKGVITCVNQKSTNERSLVLHQTE